MSDRRCARLLIEAAERDARTLRILLPTEVSDEVFGFHAQQAAEKAMKAQIALLGETYPLTHSNHHLLRRLVDLGVDMEPFVELLDFDPYAVRFRYENLPPHQGPMDRGRAIQLVDALIAEVRQAFRGETESR